MMPKDYPEKIILQIINGKISVYTNQAFAISDGDEMERFNSCKRSM